MGGEKKKLPFKREEDLPSKPRALFLEEMKAKLIFQKPVIKGTTIGLLTTAASEELDDEPKRIKSSPNIMLGSAGMVGTIENYDYAKNIKLYIEQEKLRMLGVAQRAGISEEMIEKLLKEQNVNDFYLENIKTRLGIVDKKPERVRKTIQVPKTEDIKQEEEKVNVRPVTEQLI